MDDKNKLLYEQIVDYLKNKILNREFKTNQKLPTELELAEQFGVSRITSKRALEELKQEGMIYRIRGSGSFVAPIENLGNPKINELSQEMNTNKIISIVIPFGEAENGLSKASTDGLIHNVRGVSEVLNENGYFLSIHSEHRDIKKEEEVLNKLYKNKVRGIIYYPISDREHYEFLYRLYLEEYPIITIDKYFDNIPISYVVTDNESGGYKATKYLLDLGHKNIAYASDVTIESASSVRQRYFGYCKALKESGISMSKELVNVGFKKDGAVVYLESLFKNIIKDFIQKEVTGIVAVNDMIASFLMRAALDLNIKVPDDISIVGFDNLELGKHLQVPLTTISQSFYEIGRTAARLLIDWIESGKHTYSKIVLPAELIIRNSCIKKI